MRRNASLTTALVSLLVLTSYVAAAFVDCERPADAGIRDAARRAMALAAAAPPARARPSSMQHGQGHRASTGSDQEASAPVMDRGHEMHAPATPPCHDAASMRAVCSCGCGDQRARVGGTPSRLGATIPAIHLAELPPEYCIDGPPRTLAPVFPPLLASDPVPI